MSNKRILIFSTAYFPFVGGAEIAVKEITDRLGDDISFDMITCRFDSSLPKVEQVGKVTVYRVGVGIKIVDKLSSPFLGAIKARELNKKHQYDFFWAIMATYTSGAAYIANFFQKKVPIVLTLQEGDSEKHLRYRWFGLIDASWRLALARTDMLTVISAYLANRARNLGYKGRVEVIPNGVDIKRFTSPPLAVRESTPLLNKERGRGEVVLITTSRLVKKNGVGDVIEAMKLLPENVTLNIIGDGSLESNLKSKVGSLKLENRVKFLGSINQNEIPKYLHEADIFVRPSLSEGQGISFIEAMISGLPVIATPVGGIPDFIFDPDKTKHLPPTGLFAEVRNPQSIARQVERLIKNNNLRETITANAKRLVKEKYDWDILAEQMKKRVFEPLF